MAKWSEPMAEDRRQFLKAAGMAALAPLLGGIAVAPVAAGPVAAGTVGAGPVGAGPVAGGPLPEVVAVGGVFLVNGWVLTGADLAALGLHAH